MTPTVSIVMPSYNAAAHIARSIASAQAQTHEDWELLVVDDGSTDGSGDIVTNFVASDPRIRAFRQPNAGAGAARNLGIAEARASFLAFLDADDTWHPEFLEAMIATLEAEPNASIAYCGWQNIGLGGGRDEPFVPPDYEHAGKTEALLESCRWPIHAALARTALVRDSGGFDVSLSSCMDFDLWLRLGARARLTRVPLVLAYYYHHGGGQITQNRLRVALNHWRVQQKFLRDNPAAKAAIGYARVREMTTGTLLRHGYACYWTRDLPAARQIFREVMRQHYGKLTDWKYMLPALLPEGMHRGLMSMRDSKRKRAVHEPDARR